MIASTVSSGRQVVERAGISDQRRRWRAPQINNGRGRDSILGDEAVSFLYDMQSKK